MDLKRILSFLIFQGKCGIKIFKLNRIHRNKNVSENRYEYSPDMIRRGESRNPIITELMHVIITSYDRGSYARRDNLTAAIHCMIGVALQCSTRTLQMLSVLWMEMAAVDRAMLAAARWCCPGSVCDREQRLNSIARSCSEWTKFEAVTTSRVSVLTSISQFMQIYRKENSKSTFRMFTHQEWSCLHRTHKRMVALAD